MPVNELLTKQVSGCQNKPLVQISVVRLIVSFVHAMCIFLTMQILLQGVNPGITYEYTVERDDMKTSEPLHNYTWSVVESECSASCAGGRSVITAFMSG